MKIVLVAAALAVGVMSGSAAAQAQAVRGAQEGVQRGERVGGPVGGVVGGAVGTGLGAAAGAVGVATGVAGGILGVDTRPRFHEYVEREHRPSYAYDQDLSVGAVLPDDGVSYYDVPEDYGARGYRYTVVNHRTVLVDPRTHRVVEIID